jgi:thiol-disulfide isomerase/thioredoxin
MQQPEWTPKYTLVALTGIRTEPILGIIPRKRDDVWYVNKRTYTLLNCQLIPGVRAEQLIDIGTSLIYYAPANVIHALARSNRLPRCKLQQPDVTEADRAMLLLLIELCRPCQRLDISLQAIACAYEGEYIWQNHIWRTYAMKLGVWTWRPQETVDLAIIRVNIHEHRPAMLEHIRIENQNIAYAYSKKTLRQWLELNNMPEFHGVPSDVHAHRYVISNVAKPSAVKNIITAGECVECQMAKALGRHCTKDHSWGHHMPQHVAEPAYFAPPPSAPPMEEMHHI